MKSTRREEVIHTAQKLIRLHGYNSMSMRDLAKALGIEAPSLYNHIKSKEELLKTTCFEMADRFITALDEVNDIYFNAEQKLRMAIENHIKILTSNLDMAHVFLHEWKYLSEPYLSEFIVLRDRYEQGFREIIVTGEQEGLFKEIDTKFAVLTILSSLNWIIEWYKPEGSMLPQEVAEKLSHFILSGLKKETIYK